MQILKLILIILGIIFCIYLLSIGIPKCKNEGFKLNIADFFRHTPLNTATGGYCIVLAFFCLLASLFFWLKLFTP